jgi:hypothetical protein
MKGAARSQWVWSWWWWCVREEGGLGWETKPRAPAGMEVATSGSEVMFSSFTNTARCGCGWLWQ